MQADIKPGANVGRRARRSDNEGLGCHGRNLSGVGSETCMSISTELSKVRHPSLILFYFFLSFSLGASPLVPGGRCPSFKGKKAIS